MESWWIDPYYELKSDTWRQISFTPGLIFGNWFGQDWLGDPAKVGFVNLDDANNRHIHNPVYAGVAGTYLLKTYLTNGRSLRKSMPGFPDPGQ